MEQTETIYTPNTKHFQCKLCCDIFKKPITISCGHSFCYFCIYKFMKEHARSYQYAEEHQTTSLEVLPIPLCPTCNSVIWRPIKEHKVNLVIANLISKYHLTPELKFQEEDLSDLVENSKHLILIRSLKSEGIPLPNTFTYVIFATAFIDEILEQQAQSSHVVMTWPGAPKGWGISGKIHRPEIHHDSAQVRSRETAFRAQFQGKCFVKLLNYRDIELKLTPSFAANPLLEEASSTATLSICLAQELRSRNPVTLDRFQDFFKIYDQLNNIVLLRQIYQQVEQRIFIQRKDPEQMIYCILKVLRMPEHQVMEIVTMLDDERRWQAIQEYLDPRIGRPPEDVIRINIPGQYSTPIVMAFLAFLLLLHIFTS